MRFSTLATLLWGSIVAAQTDYPELNAEFLQTSDPVTPLPQGFPWGTKTANNTNACKFSTIQITNFRNLLTSCRYVIRKYDFTVKRGKKAPDGYLKDVLIINGQFPGPLIEANWGDTIQVTVHNQITGPQEGTALHWHGLLQKTSQWEDGVPGVSQCPVPPGGTFTYSFIADLYGTSWYHSHYSAQYAGGAIGPLIIHGPDTLKYDIDKGPIILNDWFHRDYLSIVEDVVGTDVTKVGPISDSNMINGRNNWNCALKAANDTTSCNSNAGITNFRFTPGKVHRLRLINAGAEGQQKFSIDGHNMTVIANDFVPIIPYTTQVVTLGIGQRTDVLVRGIDGATGSYLMRSSIPAAPCSFSNAPDATAIVYYQHSADPLNKTVPWFPIKPDPSPPTTKTIDVDFHQNDTGHWLWFMNNVSFRANYNQPVLLLSNVGNNSFPAEWNVENYGSNSSVRILINNNGPGGFLSHPIHLHGHNMFVLSVGTGTWDGTTVVNPSNPQRRDVQLIPAGGYMVLQFTADNPGAWPLHCHIAWHVSAGLYVTVLERPADIAKLQIPSIMAQTCRDWAAFTNTTIIDQIDSGL
ncbi:oxidoreductase ptaK [Lachnellula suecica]|uniref:Oxidoreductase ptaK n=1 Tax=Lachnellula suecica TaxID=602035 RepID=A0A8T9CDY6_9HELO|nr:oxidoreductase ptaK [Lachnellula suecica]